MTSEFFQKGIKNEGVSPAGKTGSLTTAKRAFFLEARSTLPYSTEQTPLTLQVLWPHGQWPGAGSQARRRSQPVSDLMSVDVHQIHRSWSPRTFKNEAKLNMDIESGFIHS